MRLVKNTKFIALIMLVAAVLLAALILLNTRADTKRSVKILAYSPGMCTMDYPSSSCGPYEVTVQSAGGQNATYTVAGFSNAESKLYNELSMKIRKAKYQQSTVTLEVNDKGEIISVR